ncbi:MAG: SUMF1/EgtB/PvdO family nonheme iron enzyme [Ignavibacteriae bacterium]|nr:SUMF1/EgtB/PvdO family nonheme iron enzyme [Ignavibacteriota bacterium]
MKKIILILSMLFFALSLFAQEPMIKIYLNDASVKSYNIAEINNIRIAKTQSNFIMNIYQKDIITASYSTAIIDSMNFESINNIIRNLVIYIPDSLPKKHLLFDIDSIVFSIIPASEPFITSITPTSAIIGDEITITGTDFGNVQGGSSVTFTGAEALEYSSWGSSEVVVKVPEGAQSGKVAIIVNSIKSNEKTFKVIPNIFQLNPSSAKIGDTISISGNGFGIEQGTGKVYFEDVMASDIVSWSDTEIKVIVPEDAYSGIVYIRISAQRSNEVDFTLIEVPTILSINPNSFPIGSDVSISGSGFGNSQNGSTVVFKTITATTIKSWSNYQIVCTVPAGAVSGNLSVTVNSVKSNEVPYTIRAWVEAVLIPSGTFQMGNTGSSPDGLKSESPVHQVTISKSFYMSKYEVQQDLYTAVMGTNPSNNKGDNLPVDRISWYMAVDFCNKLSEKEGLTKCYTINGTSVSCNWNANGWRLPTEAEWEYACKARTTTDYYSGTTESQLAAAAWYDGNSNGVTHPVGQKNPNAFGLYDMLGNVWEPCWDWLENYSGGSATDPKGPSSGTIKVGRGGSWHNSAIRCRSSMRGWEDSPSIQSSTDGIRLVRKE